MLDHVLRELMLVDFSGDVHPHRSTTFGFRFAANWLAHAANPDDPPLQWHITQIEVPFTQMATNGELVFGGAVMREGGWVYVFGMDSQVT